MAVFVAGCGESPTDPQTRALNGAWEGRIVAYPVDEDWTTVRLTATTAGDQVTGSLKPIVGPQHPVTGQRVGSGFALEVHDLPRTAPCAVNLYVSDIERSAIRGRVSGRCANTLISTFRLVRVQ